MHRAAGEPQTEGRGVADWQRVDLDPAFELEIPAGWEAERDEEGGVLVSAADGAGLLHLVAFPQPPGPVQDPGEELYAFLEQGGIELEEDEIEDVELADGAEMSVCEYIAEEDPDAGDVEATYWMVAVAVRPGCLVLCSYSCPLGEQDAERAVVLDILRGLRMK